MGVLASCSSGVLGKKVKEPFSGNAYESNARYWRAVGKGQSSKDNIAKGKADIDAKVRIQHLPDLKRRLKILKDEHRNAGSHPEPYGRERLNELMNILYARDEGLWEMFLDALVEGELRS